MKHLPLPLQQEVKSILKSFNKIRDNYDNDFYSLECFTDLQKHAEEFQLLVDSDSVTEKELVGKINTFNDLIIKSPFFGITIIRYRKNNDVYFSVYYANNKYLTRVMTAVWQKIYEDLLRDNDIPDNLQHEMSIDISSNKITKINGGIPGAICKNLCNLVLSNNELHEVPKVLTELYGLKMLDISNNKITKFPQIIEKMAKLETLDINGNPLNESCDKTSAKKLHKIIIDLDKRKFLPQGLKHLGLNANSEKLDALKIRSNFVFLCVCLHYLVLLAAVGYGAWSSEFKKAFSIAVADIALLIFNNEHGFNYYGTLAEENYNQGRAKVLPCMLRHFDGIEVSNSQLTEVLDNDGLRRHFTAGYEYARSKDKKGCYSGNSHFQAGRAAGDYINETDDADLADYFAKLKI